jgi:thioesterase domain-containing protein
MLDTPLPQRRPLLKTDRAIIQWQDLKSKGIMHLLQWPIRRIKWELSKHQASSGKSETSTQHQFNNTGIEVAFLQSVETYKMKPWTGPVVLFRPPLVGHWQVSQDQWIDSQRAYVFHDNDWSQWTPHMRVFEVPGDHDSMVLEPNVRVMAARMMVCIETAENNVTAEEQHQHDILARAAE